MAVLTKPLIAKIIMRLYRRLGGASVNYSTPQVSAAAQVIEDWYTLSKAQVSTDIDIATGGPVFSTAQKKLIFTGWLLEKFGEEDA